RLLKEILRAFLAAGQVQQIAEQPELVLLNQPIQQIGIAPLERAGQRLGVIEHEGREAYRARQLCCSHWQFPCQQDLEHAHRMGLTMKEIRTRTIKGRIPRPPVLASNAKSLKIDQ